MRKTASKGRLLKRAWPGAGKLLDRVSAVAEEEIDSYAQRSSLSDTVARFDTGHCEGASLEMFHTSGKPNKADGLWPRLFNTALNKMRLGRRKEQHTDTMS